LGEENERSPYENTKGGITWDAYWGNDFPKMAFFQEAYSFIMMLPWENVSCFPKKALPNFPEKTFPSFLGKTLLSFPEKMLPSFLGNLLP